MAVVRTMGFAGSAFIDNLQVLSTNGSLSKDMNINYLTSVSIPNVVEKSGGDSRARMRYGTGTYGISGNMSFDLTAPSLRLLRPDDGLLRRGKQFTVRFFGGNQVRDAYQVKGCYATSFSVSGGSNGILACSLSFVSNRDWQPIEPDTVSGEPSYGAFIRDDANEPLGYWYSGVPTGGVLSAVITDWTLNMSQEATPVYLNGWTSDHPGDEGGDGQDDDLYARYIRIGQTNYDLSINTVGGDFPVDENGDIRFVIASEQFTIQSVETNRTWTPGGVSQLSTFSHTFEGYASLSDGSGGVVIEGR